MGKIDDMIQRFCPNGVEYKKLGDVGIFYRGKGLQKKDFTSSGVGCIHYGQIYTHYKLFTDSTISFVNPELAKKLAKVHPGDLIITNTSENVEDVCMAVAWLGNVDIVTGGHASVFHHHENPKYLSYYFKTLDFFNQKIKYARGTKVIEVKIEDLAKIEIPVPPLEIQNEIVKVLDNFTALTAELEAELEARRQQYEFYRDRLTGFGKTQNDLLLSSLNPDSKLCRLVRELCPNGVEWRNLGDIAKFKYGYTAKALDSGDERYIRITDIMDNGCLNPNDSKYINSSEETQPYELKKGDLLVARTGATYGKTLYYNSDRKASFASFLIKIEFKDKSINNRYYWHLSKSNLYWKQANKYVSRGGQQQFNTNALEKIKIPVPPMPVQEEIVRILDRFDKLVNDISEGLPAEIAARQKQYEYYRDKLLTFKRLGA